jgi:dihydrofolate synthase/folylpolyglutamate synthase
MVFLPHWPIPHEKVNIMRGIERVLTILERLGSPHEKLPPVIHVTGTNGKGSTCAYLTAIFKDAGLRVHRYISPHLERYNERIMLAGEEITDEFLYSIIEETRLAAEGVATTFFEATTVAAFLAFSKVEADVVILEVGMGGTYDATNVITEPLLSIITPVAFDHMEYLGTTLTEIASEKAGIIKQNRPVTVSWQYSEAMAVIVEKAKEMAAPLSACGLDWNFESTSDGFNFIDLEQGHAYRFPRPGLAGIHQILNAANVVASIRMLEKFNISYENICNGLKNVYWPGRLEKITKGVLYDLLPKDCELWIDGAHNDNGAQMIAASIAAQWSDKDIYVINGRTAKRNIKSFLKYFEGIAKAVYGVKVRSEPSGEDALNIQTAAEELGFESYACDGLSEAIAMIKASAKGPFRILVTGSLYLAADVKLANKF